MITPEDAAKFEQFEVDLHKWVQEQINARNLGTNQVAAACTRCAAIAAIGSGMRRALFVEGAEQAFDSMREQLGDQLHTAQAN